jgi:hypothetical protein
LLSTDPQRQRGRKAARWRIIDHMLALHVDLWLIERRRQALRWMRDAGGRDLTLDDLDLVAEPLLAACERS